MVKVNDSLPMHPDGGVALALWLQKISEKSTFPDLELLRSACNLAHVSGLDHAIETGETCLHHGLAMASVLEGIGVDQETLAAAILYSSEHDAELTLEDIAEQLSPQIAHLVSGVEKMSTLSQMGPNASYPHSKQQIDNMRKMLLAMVDDVRVVLIKLADRLCVLRSAAPISASMLRTLAEEVMFVYAPLANRLGIGAIKWEMEDLAFRYLQPEAYQAIAKDLKAKRLERDRYVQSIVTLLTDALQAMDLPHFSVYGRSKHLHSIYRKMTLKAVPLDQIYDVTAVRVLVDSEADCYAVLDCVHRLWPRLVHEYDDYIMKPKANGYQSLHTAVQGPENRVFEVQIRTFHMHDLAEMGVAAHWKYKEGTTQFKASHERKIEWLRHVLAWHQDVSAQHGADLLEAGAMDDRVYVFTPDGDILDLPQKATALDFAYHVHTDMGHRCRGAKVNGMIVPLTYLLQTGDRVEILIGKESRPSRDWINPNAHYLHSSRAKAKVMHWFKMQDSDKNAIAGRELLDKELKALGIKTQQLQDLLPIQHAKTLDEVYVALGRGDLKLIQVLNRLTPSDKGASIVQPEPQLLYTPQRKSKVCIEGVGNLLTHMARCCQPLPGEQVIGYITVGRGVSIHRQDCPNVLRATEKQQERFLVVTWDEYHPKI
ncbi:MAG: bifunctional (p)ppGpp synthetase/guanosine-3',5'-bis(diphosphate) 3'-pyrophosphohydrolase [Legionellales bacterium]|nr:bifunctional (p)ppGpp synthetase/guanosine-3',5'-bis(diphosphate) 3'-pyrophosphohydrolase [Legionellales bacterium]